MLKRLLAVFTAMLLTLATFAFAAELRGDHPSTYTVRKGDTLWDISARFLTKPWLWPEIWQANPQVKNPHLIYPGDVLSLEYLNGQPVLTSRQEPQVHVSDAVTAIPLAQVEPFLKQLTVVDDIKSLPYVVGLEEDRLLSTSGQTAFVRGLAGAQPGQKVQIARPINLYALGTIKRGHYTGGLSVLDFRGDPTHRHWSSVDSKGEAHGTPIGYELMAQGIGEVTQVQGDVATVLLTGGGRDVRVGDRVLPPPADYDAQFLPQPPASVPEAAFVLAVADGEYAAGPRSVVALSIGARDGVRNGTTFSIWHDGALRPDTVAHRNLISAKGDKVAMPDSYVGHVMVFRTFDKVSYGLIMDGIRPARVGDYIKHPDAVQ